MSTIGLSIGDTSSFVAVSKVRARHMRAYS